MIRIDKDAIRFLYKGGQINCHWNQLNIFMHPALGYVSLRRLKNFFYFLRKGLGKEVEIVLNKRRKNHGS